MELRKVVTTKQSEEGQRHIMRFQRRVQGLETYLRSRESVLSKVEKCVVDVEMLRLMLVLKREES